MTEREALKLALEALEWNLPVVEDWGGKDNLSLQHKAITAIREALAQPEQEPVAWMTITPYGEEDDIWYENPEGKLLDDWTYKPLYTTPPQRTWVGLTDDEIIDVIHPLVMADMADEATDYEIARAIEATLKEKNT